MIVCKKKVCAFMINDILKRVSNKINYTINVIDQLGGIIKADPTKFNPIQVDLLDFIKEEVPKHVNNDKRIELEFVGKNGEFVDLDKKQFAFLIHNFINNAIRHGLQKGRKNIYLRFEISEERDFIIFAIMNDGIPISKNVSIEKFLKPFAYFGSTGNSGLGGFIIHNVLINHNASLEINTDIPADNIFKTQFIIKFKRKKNATN